ncbi:ATP-binding protein [Verrucomicrobiaceae bacterium N1E253]|uniref:ATP-binding protein n=1 Tax=Oceaniferula marina TaxID=2748318 RepID=A0A851GNY4_9BACT|nr:ATP-binding protein [Oceaniferula marina]NWK57571.1 ATP-binding protein [Oceaniferula marina]
MEHAIFKLKAARIKVDHTKISVIDPEVALLLVAEFSRYRKHSPNLSLLGQFGKKMNDDVVNVLAGVGYLNRFYPGFATAEGGKVRAGSRIYIGHRSGKKVTAKDVHILVNEFEEFYNMDHLSRVANKRLRSSLIELMDNAVSHAYERTGHQRWVEGIKWWMMGYKDLESGETYFALMDQGIGMPATLKGRFMDKGILIPRNEEELVVTAFRQSMSRTGKKNRGLGLPRLREFAEASDNGELFVQTHHVRCWFNRSRGIRSERSDIRLAGTLIVWKATVSLK